MCAAAFLPMYVGALYSRRVTKGGAISGMVTGFAVSTIYALFIHQKTAKDIGLCKLIFGEELHFFGGMPWGAIDPLVVALPASILVTIIVSLLTKPHSAPHLDMCMNGVEVKKKSAEDVVLPPTANAGV